jgi:hypothetical protein
MTTLSLSVLDRLQISIFVPKQGKIIEMEISKGITEKVRLTAKEITDWEIKEAANGSISWNPNKVKEVPFHFEQVELDQLKKGVELADAGDNITLQNLELAKKIRESKQEMRVVGKKK